MPRIKVEINVPDGDYCDKDSMCPVCTYNGYGSHCCAVFGFRELDNDPKNNRLIRLDMCKAIEKTQSADYVVNAGVSWGNLALFYTSASKQDAIEMAEHLPIKCVEVVYSPCDDIDTNEIVWSNRKKGEMHFQKYESKLEE